MKADFWHEKWDKNDIGFHEGAPNRLMTRHIQALPVAPGGRIFLPLCGKTRDIGWLLDQGYRVAGAELSEIAVRALFDDLSLAPNVEKIGALKRFSAEGIDVFVGDIFDLTKERLGPVDAIYDRAALVALPDGLRADYSRHLIALTDAAPQLLLCFEYDQSEMAGPPFSIDAVEVERHYAETYAITSLERAEAPNRLKGIAAATENTWKLMPR